MKSMWYLAAAVGVPLLAAGVPVHAETDTPAPATTFQWRRSTPEQQGVDSGQLLRSIRRIRDENLDVRSLVLVRNDHVILELYVHPYSAQTVHNVKSVSKSVLSALVGIALREGILEDLDQPVHTFFPEYFADGATGDKAAITLRHLLTMTSGLDLDENGPKMNAVFASDDWIRATFAADMAARPGERFLYSTPLTHTMVGVLTRAGGGSVHELANEHLFGPLQFGAVQWKRGPQGLPVGGAELFLTTPDMAKFGLLYLHRGQWMGRQLVPAAWVAESTRGNLPPGQTRYGYWWWLNPDGGYKAIGWGGQGITVIPELAMVVAGTAGNPTATDRMFRDFAPGTITDEPLPPNPKAVAALDRLVRELEHPTPRPVPPLPDIAADVSGHTYVLEKNPRGFREFTFHFEAGASTATIVSTRRDRTLEAQIGLDGIFRMVEMGAEGPMPEGNRIALRGRWTDDDRFVVDSHQVGDPLHTTWIMRFDGRRLEAEVDILPLGSVFTLSGEAAP